MALLLAACTSTPSPSATAPPASPQAHWPTGATESAPPPTPVTPPLVIDALSVSPTGALWTEGGNVLSIGSADGSSWQTAVMPPPESSDEDSPAFVLDQSHAWVVTTGPGTTETGNGPQFDHAHLIVNRTTDGGRTWQSAKVSGDWPDTARSIAFVDARHGYLMASGGRSNAGASAVLRSDDGGASWALVRVVEGGADGDLGSLIAVTTPTTIWAAAQEEAGPVNHPVLDVSRDGGQTWSSANLPRLGRWGGTASNPVSPPIFLDESRGFVAVNTTDPIATGDPGQNQYTLFYSTRDGGATWALDTGRPFPSRAVAFLSGETWVALVNGATALEVTRDAGATWQTVAPTGADGLAWIVGNGSRLIGAVSPDGTSQSSELVQSADAGATWATLPGPSAVGPPCSTADLAITVTNAGGGAGTVGGILRFRNVSRSACTLTGVPALVAVTAAGALTTARYDATVGTPFPMLADPPVVSLAPGDSAFAAYGGGDNPSNGGTCPPPYHSFRVSVPGDSTAVELPAFNEWLGTDQPSCAGIAVTAIASQAAVEPYVDLSTSAPMNPSPSAIAAAKEAVQAYTGRLVRGDWAAAFAALAPSSRLQWGSLERFRADRSEYFKSVGGKFTVIAPAPEDLGPITDWQSAMDGTLLDVTQAVLVEVDYPALPLNNAGYELFIVQPGSTGLQLFPVR